MCDLIIIDVLSVESTHVYMICLEVRQGYSFVTIILTFPAAVEVLMGGYAYSITCNSILEKWSKK